MRRVITAIAVAAMMFTATCGGHQRNGAHVTALTTLSPVDLPSKTASVIPPAQRLVARDAGIALSAGGYTLSWKYENPGDYSQDGKAGVEDVTPIAQHFGEAISPDNEWIKVNGAGAIGVSELTPIAMNWASEVTGYRIDGAPSVNGPWNEVASITVDDGDKSSGRLAFSNEIAPGFIYYRIATLTPDGDAAYSNVLIAPSNEPIIYDVSPTSGYQHEEYAFAATASGQAPLTYAWDFGGGASPNTSLELSPTVTLSDAGEYSAALTISNSYGPTTFQFTLTVSARDMWAHTWGGSSYDEAVDVCTDDEGNIYVLGKIQSFAAGKEDTLVLKYASDGTLLWARTWGGIGYDSPVGIAVLSNGEITVGGRTKSFGSGMDDVFILKYSPDGILMSQKVWGTTGSEVVIDMGVDGFDNVYFAGYQFYGGFPTMFAVKLNTSGTGEWAKTWGLEGDDRATCLAVDELGNVYISGTPDTDSASYDTVLLKLDADGQLLWGKRWGGPGNEGATGIVIDRDERVYLVGLTNSFGVGDKDALLMEWNPFGEVLFAKTWGTSSYDFASDIAISLDGNLYVSGCTKSFNSSWQGMLLIFNRSGALLLSPAVEDDSRLASLSLDADGNVFLAGYANSNNWTWGNIDGVVSDASTEVEDYVVSIADLEGISKDVEGTENIPTGIEDTGGGEIEALVVKNFPR